MSRNQGEGSSNRVRGPTSALSSFLREQGINVQNRSRRARREQPAEEPAEEPVASTEEQETVTVNNRPRKKKRRAESDEDEFAPSSSRKVVKGRARILFCTVCNSRFARNTDKEEESICDVCKSGKVTQAAPKPKRKRLNIQKKETMVDKVPSLQDICISVVARYIDEVEAFGVISDDSFEKLSKIISRNRKLNSQTSRLFMESYRKTLTLYDCTNMDETALMNVAQFCPNMEALTLIYCGQIHDEILSFYQERLHHLKSLSLSGAFLITQGAWISFFEKINSRIESFGLRHSNRFNLACVEALTAHCPNIQALDLGQLNSLDSDWLPQIAKLSHLKRLELAWPSSETTIRPEDLVHLLEAIGPQLTELSLRGFDDLTDEVLFTIQKNCRQLQKLNLEQSHQLTSKAAIEFFDHWQNQGLTHLDLSRCILLDDNVLKAIMRHSGKTLVHLNIHSLELLTPDGLETLVEKDEHCNELKHLDCGFVRAMDDFVLQKLITQCKSLENILVWGCHLLTNTVQVKNNYALRIIGRETV